MSAAVKPPLTADERLDALEVRVFGRKMEPNRTMIVGETMAVPISAVDAKGETRPLPVGDTFIATTNTTGRADVGISAELGGPTLIIRALAVATDLLVTVTDSAGLLMVTERLDILPVPVPETAEKAAEPDPRPIGLALDMTGGKILIPDHWTTDTRPVAPPSGTKGFNSTLGVEETWDGTKWVEDPKPTDPQPTDPRTSPTP